MPNQTEQIAASQQRQQVPADWQLVWAEWTNDSLDSLSHDDTAPPKVRIWAGWELDYRIAFGIDIADPAVKGDPRAEIIARLEAQAKGDGEE